MHWFKTLECVIIVTNKCSTNFNFCRSIAALRIKYRSAQEKFLEESISVKEPFHLFKLWLNEACETPEILEPNAFCLSTVSKWVELNDANNLCRSIFSNNSIYWNEIDYSQRQFSISAFRTIEKRWKGRHYILHKLRKSQSQRNCMKYQMLFWTTEQNLWHMNWLFCRNQIQMLRSHSIGFRCESKSASKALHRKYREKHLKSISINVRELVKYVKRILCCFQNSL